MNTASMTLAPESAMNSTAMTGVVAPEMPQIIARALTLCIISFMTLFGNVLVVTAVLRYRRLKTSANVFVANLAISNLVTGVLLIFLTWNVIVNHNALGATGCQVWGMFAGSSVVCSTFTMALVALNRYVLIAHTKSYRVAFNPKKCVMMSLGAWLIGIGSLVGTVTGWSEIRYNQKTKACSYSREANISFHYFAIGLGFGIPLITVAVCYSLLYYTVWKSKRRIAAQKAQQTQVQKPRNGPEIEPDEPDNRKQYKRQPQPANKDVKLTKMLVTIFLVYVGCLGPYSFVNMIDSDASRFPEVVHICVTWMLFSNGAINPFIYGFMNKNFRDAYVALLGRKCPCVKKYLEKARLDTGEATIVVNTSI